MLDRTRRPHGRALVAASVVIATVVLSACGNDADNNQDSLKPKGPVAREIMDLFTPFFWIAVVVGVFVTFATIYVALRFREKPGQPTNPKQVHGNSVLEISWTIIPALILLIMAVPTIATIWSIAEKPKGDVVHVNVTAKQWWWEYEYTNQGQKLITANEMHIPAGKWVDLSLIGPDNGVIHSFWVPNLAGKKDVVPGRNQFLKLKADEDAIGVYRGQCAEYCGLSHANMRLRVVVESQADFDKWVAQQQAKMPPANTKFVEDVLTPKWGCTNCHSFTTDGEGADTGPNLTHVGDRQGFAGDMYDMTFENLWKWVHNAPSRKPSGNLQGWMPNFSEGPDGMTEDEAKEIAHFLLCDTATNPAIHPDCQ